MGMRGPGESHSDVILRIEEQTQEAIHDGLPRGAAKFRIDLPTDGFPSDGLMTTTILARWCRSGRRPPHHRNHELCTTAEFARD
jgi:hypothetical protein